MTRIKCFFLESTGRVSVSLRRYTYEGPLCPKGKEGDHHNAFVRIDGEPVERDTEGYIQNGLKALAPRDDPRWPRQCTCGYVFQKDDEWQRFVEEIYRRTDTGEDLRLRDASPGAMWYAWWLDRSQVPQGEHNLMVRTPGGDWCVDSQSKNCPMKDDTQMARHHCWIRHGTPPDVTVDKQGGPTCPGGGSILCNSYHGFLRNGYLED